MICGGERPACQPPEPGDLFTIKQVGDVCGLPHAVIAQLVPRTWTPAGWMYSAAQVDAAVLLAAQLRRSRATESTPVQHDSVTVLACSRCGALTACDQADRGRWLTVLVPDSARPLGCDYCPGCVIDCAACLSDADACRACPQCRGAGRVPRP